MNIHIFQISQLFESVGDRARELVFGQIQKHKCCKVPQLLRYTSAEGVVVQAPVAKAQISYIKFIQFALLTGLLICT